MTNYRFMGKEFKMINSKKMSNCNSPVTILGNGLGLKA